ncbi:hypothetical protein GCK32_020113 [Trichostrongylus colubriformis]|uniref:Uncharacterized protein n=1 Tax=Trichostrongylus colubriformis TaxID=6319 RepID=A0AAN8EZZ9_TRICO
MEKSRLVQTIISCVLCLLLVVALGILGITIAVLVEVLNQKNAPSPSNPGNQNLINVPSPRQIPSGNANYQGYKSAVDLFKYVATLYFS